MRGQVYHPTAMALPETKNAARYYLAAPFDAAGELQAAHVTLALVFCQETLANTH